VVRRGGPGARSAAAPGASGQRGTRCRGGAGQKRVGDAGALRPPGHAPPPPHLFQMPLENVVAPQERDRGVSAQSHPPRSTPSSAAQCCGCRHPSGRKSPARCSRRLQRWTPRPARERKNWSATRISQPTRPLMTTMSATISMPSATRKTAPPPTPGARSNDVV